MKHIILFILFMVCCVAAMLPVCAQQNEKECGMLTTMEHPTDPNQGKILAMMSNYCYIPIELKIGEYVNEKEISNGEVTISGQKIQQDSIYYFEKIWNPEKESYTYNFEQIYKGAKYIEVEGAFIVAFLSDYDGVATPFVDFCFWNMDGKVQYYSRFDKSEEPLQSMRPLGGTYVYSGSYNLSEEKFIEPPLFFYTLRVLTNEKGAFIPTHIISSRKNPLATDAPKMKETTINLEQDAIYIQTEYPIKQVILTDLNGVSTCYLGEGQKQMTLTPPEKKHNYIISIQFSDLTKTFTQKITTL